MRPQTFLIFDVDGTLSDSMATIIDAWREALQRSELAIPTDDQLRFGIGRSILEGFESLFPRASDRDYDTFARHYRDVYRGMVVGNEPPLYPGVSETLQTLFDQGHRLAIATGKSRVGLDRMLEAHKMGHLFQSTITADQARSKPHPEMIELLLQDSGAAKGDTVMIGDTTFDLLMARAAGVYSVGVTYGGHARSELARCEPTHLVERICDLVPWVAGFSPARA
jgi:phosphoglycolate phosphatase